MSSRNQQAPDAAPQSEQIRDLADSRALALAMAGGPGQGYNEEAFRYFLNVERKRSERSRRRFLLLLVDLKKHSDTNVWIDSGLASKLVAILSPCLRDTDFIGWYREGRTIGAVLTHLTDTPGTDISSVVGARVNHALSRCRIRRDIAGQLQMRIYQLPPALEHRG